MNTLNSVCLVLAFSLMSLQVLGAKPSSARARLREKMARFDDRGLTRLMNAVESGDLKAVKKQIRERPEDVAVADEDGQTALLMATSLGHTEIVKALLAADSSNINVVSKHGLTALISALDFPQIVSMLTAAGADIRTTFQGRTALAEVEHALAKPSLKNRAQWEETKQLLLAQAVHNDEKKKNEQTRLESEAKTRIDKEKQRADRRRAYQEERHRANIEKKEALNRAADEERAKKQAIDDAARHATEEKKSAREAAKQRRADEALRAAHQKAQEAEEQKNMAAADRETRNEKRKKLRAERAETARAMIAALAALRDEEIEQAARESKVSEAEAAPATDCKRAPLIVELIPTPPLAAKDPSVVAAAPVVFEPAMTCTPEASLKESKDEVRSVAASGAGAGVGVGAGAPKKSKRGAVKLRYRSPSVHRPMPRQFDRKAGIEKLLQTLIEVSIREEISKTRKRNSSLDRIAAFDWGLDELAQNGIQLLSEINMVLSLDKYMEDKKRFPAEGERTRQEALLFKNVLWSSDIIFEEIWPIFENPEIGDPFWQPMARVVAILGHSCRLGLDGKIEWAIAVAKSLGLASS
jgi:hypothetical protein